MVRALRLRRKKLCLPLMERERRLRCDSKVHVSVFLHVKAPEKANFQDGQRKNMSFEERSYLHHFLLHCGTLCAARSACHEVFVHRKRGIREQR